MFKSKRIVLLILLVAIFLTSCGESTPEPVIKNIVGAMKNFETEKISEYVLDYEESEVQEELEENSMTDAFQEYISRNASKIEYEIEDIDIDGDKALADVKFKYIDGTRFIQNVLSDYMGEMLPLFLTGIEPTEEEMEEILLEIIEKYNLEEEEKEDKFIEKNIEMEFIKEDNKWLLEEFNDDLVNVMTSNFIDILERFEENLDDSSGEDIQEEDSILITKNIGDEVEFATIKLKVNNVEEKYELENVMGDKVKAKDGTKFILVNVDVENITKSAITFDDNFLLIDNQEREFNNSNQTIDLIDDNLTYKELAPNIIETGTMLYEIPEDSKEYSIYSGKKDTDEVYEIILK